MAFVVARLLKMEIVAVVMVVLIVVVLFGGAFRVCVSIVVCSYSLLPLFSFKSKEEKTRKKTLPVFELKSYFHAFSNSSLYFLSPFHISYSSLIVSSSSSFSSLSSSSFLSLPYFFLTSPLFTLFLLSLPFVLFFPHPFCVCACFFSASS